MTENCELKGRPCQGYIEERTTWDIVGSICAQNGEIEEIDTSSLVARDIFDLPPVEVVGAYSEICDGKHSCNRCTDLIKGVAVTLGLTTPKPE